MKRSLMLMIALVLMVPLLPIQSSNAQDGSCPPLLFVDGQFVVPIGGAASTPLYANAGDATPSGDSEALFFLQVFDHPPVCINGVNWYYAFRAQSWVPETAVTAFWYQPALPQGIAVPLNPPQMSAPQAPLPAMTFNPAFPTTPPSFVSAWDWAAISQDVWYTAPDPLTLQLPAVENSGLPALPVDLNTVYYSDVAALNTAQLTLLAQNGFVVVPAPNETHMDDIYNGKGWEAAEGTADFITTDALLNSLYTVYENALHFLEVGDFYNRISHVIASAYQGAEVGYFMRFATDIEGNARNAAVYYGVALQLLGDGGNAEVLTVLQTADPEIMAEAAPLADMARRAEGRLAVPFLEDVDEDFSQYKPRGYYAGDPLLESYFRAMMWLGRITFRAAKAEETLTAMFVHDALRPIFGDWEAMEDMLAFIVGPMNNITPYNYNELFPLAGIERATLADFQAALQALPAPRVNTIVLPIGTEADEVDDLSRGYQLFGQRFTLDGYIMNELIYPQAGEAGAERVLPLGLDVPTALGSDMAYELIRQLGENNYRNYDTNLSALRTEINAFTPDAWLENLYGGWLWALQPLALPSALTPPMMQTDAWRFKDLNTFLGSWTQLKHATLLYAAQPMGGLGGGGEVPVINSYSYVEPNPLVFARIAIVAALLRQGLIERGVGAEQTEAQQPMLAVLNALTNLAVLSARLADMSARQLNGGMLGYEDYFWLQEHFGQTLWYIRYTIEVWLSEPPVDMALVADVASNAAAGVVLEEAIGTPEYIYVVVPHPLGYQLTRGAVYSTYEFVQPIDQRLTDQEWREMLATNPPSRRIWTSLYRSE